MRGAVPRLSHSDVLRCVQATMVCLDNSEPMRNGDYAPDRWQAQTDAVNIICGAKTQVSVLHSTARPSAD
eukprot:9285549-Ditylum_brightwellii.AAC.1